MISLIPASLQLVFYLVFVMHYVNMTCFIISSFGIVIRHSPLTRSEKFIVKTKIREKENDEWLSYCQDHTGMHVAQTCLLNTLPRQFLFLADDYLVSRLHIQVRIMGNFGFSGGVPWLSHTQGALCFIAKKMSKM